MTRGDSVQEFHGAERRLLGSALHVHSMHLVGSESCGTKGVPTTWPRSVPAKVAPRSDDEGRVANW